MLYSSTMILFVAVAIITLVPTGWADHACPPQEELGQCFCTHGDMVTNTTTPATTAAYEFYTTEIQPTPSKVMNLLLQNYLSTTVTCNASSSLIAMEKAMLAFHRKSVYKLVLSRVPPKREHVLSVLPSRWLINTRVKVVEIEDTVLSGDFIAVGEPFAGQEQSLIWLSARRCHLYGALTFDTKDTINTQGLNKLSYLEGLDLSYNQLTTVSNTAFRNPPANMSTLILAYNSLKTLESTCFTYMSKLKYIDLSHNLLESVTRMMFINSQYSSSPAKLEYIDLSWNYLKNLPADFFNAYPFLKTVKLEQNFLYSMPGNPWSSVWKNLAFVNVTGNFIRCDCNLQWMIPMIPERFSVGNGPMVHGNCTEDSYPDANQHRLSTLRRDQLEC